ncbi:MAG: T9SS type A sorting domain-containing protein [Candidatus Kapabacteria bacterium]|nr:T9SS type A sorting domain-containing protein [Candidatus Kapabacteria bacterium]
MLRKIENWNSLKCFSFSFIILIIAFVTITLSTNSYAQGDWKILNPTNSPSARFGHSITPLPKGELLLFAGQESAQKMYNDLHSYNPPLEIWQLLYISNRLPSERANHCTWYLDGKLYVHGGEDKNRMALLDLWNYDPTTREWTQKPQTNPSPSARYYHKANVTNDGKAIISGGFDGSKVLNDIWLYDYITNQWTQYKTNIPVAAESHISEIVDDDLYIFTNGQGFKYNLITNSWTSGLEAPPLMGGSGSVLGENEQGQKIIFIFGGLDMQNNFSDKVYEYNTATGKLTQQTKTMPMPINKVACAKINQLKRVAHPKISQPNDYNYMKVIFFGGMSGSWSNLIPMNQTWVYQIGEISSVEDQNENNELKIYPNPATNIIEIKLGNYDKIITLEIFDLLGQLVLSRYSLDDEKIDVSELAAGIYILKLTSEKAEYNKMLIIR